MTMAAGIGALEDEEYTKANCQTIIENREFTANELKKLGFEMTNSKSNFIFAKHPNCDGKEIYLELKEKGILVRYFGKEKIDRHIRITIGTKEQMCALIGALKEIVK